MNKRRGKYMDKPNNSFTSDTESINQKFSTPQRLFSVIIAAVFLAEVIAMLAIYLIQPEPYWVETLLDAMIMTVLIFPVLYLLHFRTLLEHIAERKRVETLLSKVLENLPVGVWITNKSGTIVHGNLASQEIWAGARYVGLDHYGDYKGWWLDSGKLIEPHEWAAARALERGEVSVNEEVEIECFDGSHKIILNSAVPIYEQSMVQSVIIVNQDITERKRAEQEVAKSEALFKAAFQILPVGAWITDNDGEIIYGNPAGQEIWAGARYVGIEQFGEYRGWWLSTGKFIEPEEWAVARAIKNGETSLNEEIEIESFDGTHKIILNSAIPVLDEQNKMHGVFVVNQDITRRKRYEQELIYSNELIERAFNSIDIMIAYLDRNFNFIRVNEAYAASTGHPAEYFTGKNHFTLYPHSENQAIFQSVVDTGEPYSVFEKPFEYPEFPEHGVTYWNWRVQPVHAADRSVQGVVLSLVDVTERKLAQLQLDQQHQELQALSIAEHKQRLMAETLNAASLALTKTLSLETVMDTLLDYACRGVSCDLAYIVIAENESDLTLRAVHGIETDNLNLAINASFDARDIPCIQEVITTQKSLLIRDTRQYPGWTPVFKPDIILNWIGVPIMTGDKAIGILALAQTKPDTFHEEHIHLAEAIVAQASVAIQNAWLFEQVLSGHERLQSLSRRLVEVQESERRYIARELHDEASQALTALMFGLSLLEQDINQPELILARVAELKQLTDQVLEDLHRLAIDLRPASLDYIGLVSALEQLVKDTDQRYSLKAQFKAVRFSQKDRQPDYVETALYRIVQEALTNVVRHSNANHVDVILEKRDDKIVIMVEDDGIGFDTTLIHKQGHLGLLGIQERAQMLAGDINIESKPGGGTTLVVEVPCVD